MQTAAFTKPGTKPGTNPGVLADQPGIGDKLAFLATYSRYYLSVTAANSGQLSNLLLHELDGLVKVSQIDSEGLRKYDVSALVANGFGLRGLTSLEPLETFCQDCSVRPIVLVEQSDQVSDKKLRQVFLLVERLGLGLVLLGSKPLQKRKVCHQFANQILHTTVARLSAGDVRQLVRRHYSEKVQLSESDIDHLIDRSDEVKGNLDSLVEEMIDAPKHPIGLPLVHMSGLVVLAVMLVGGWWSLRDEAVESHILSIPIAEKTAGIKETPPAIDVVDAGFDTKPKVESQVESSSGPGLLARKTPTPKTEPIPTAESQNEVSVPEKKPTPEVMVAQKNVDEAPIQLTSQDPNDWVNNLAAPAAGIREQTPVSWVKQAAPPGAYTLQMMGSHDRDRVLKFIAQQGSDEGFGYFETKHRNQAWFVLTYGQYPDRDSALASISGLAPELQAQKPWARSISSIRDK